MDNNKLKLPEGVNGLRERAEPVVDIALVYTTFPDMETATSEGTTLVEAGLAACVNVFPGMTSIYVWDGALHRDCEVVMIVKTQADLTGRVIAEVRTRHPYSNPAILVLPVIGGSEEYLDWLRQNTAAPRN